MLFRRSGHTDDRRRRVLTESLAASALNSPPPTWRPGPIGSQPGTRRSVHYGDATFLDRQPRPTDLIPTRLAWFLLGLVLGGALIAGLEALHVWMPRIAQWTGSAQVRAFDLSARGSLAGWCSSMLLALAALVALIVYSVRRHKADDYRGHYRVWLWAAGLWLVLSIDTTAGLHGGFARVMVRLTGTPLFGDGSAWWVVAYGFVLGGIGTRLLADMLPCRLSTLALASAFSCYAGAAAVRFGASEYIPYRIDPVMLSRGMVLSGNLLVLVSMGLHARYVILDAEGLIPHRARRPSEGQSGGMAAGEPALAGFVVHPPHGVPHPNAAALTSARPVQAGPPYGQAHVVSAAAPLAAPSAGLSAWPVQRKLTKQEKKALRERLERMRREREARQGYGA
ncbi:MAG: hypothetical protein ACUVUC_14985 [Thermoguttaceae bacterium]